MGRGAGRHGLSSRRWGGGISLCQTHSRPPRGSRRARSDIHKRLIEGIGEEMEASFISWRVESEVGVLTLNRPQSRNALSRAVLSELGAHLAMLVGNSEVRALVIRGEGKMFCAGADIGEMQGLSPAEAESFARLGQRIFSALEQLPIPVVALVHGGAFGGGLELALACDIRFAATGTQF